MDTRDGSNESLQFSEERDGGICSKYVPKKDAVVFYSKTELDFPFLPVFRRVHLKKRILYW